MDLIFCDEIGPQIAVSSPLFITQVFLGHEEHPGGLIVDLTQFGSPIALQIVEGFPVVHGVADDVQVRSLQSMPSLIDEVFIATRVN